MQNHDNAIISAIYKGKLPRAKYLKNDKRYPNITEYLLSRFEYVDSLKESLDRIKHNFEVRPICKECGNKVRYLGLNKGKLVYQNFCCSKCSNSNKSKQQKTKETCLRKYGVDNPWKSQEVIEKCTKTKTMNCQSKYGVDNVMQIDEVRRKSIENQHRTNQERYGVNTVFSVPEIHKKCEESYKETCLNKYGVDNYSKTDEFIEKMKKTNQERYGVDFFYQSNEFKAKYKKTCLNKYSVEYATQSNEFKAKYKKTCLNRYGVENYALSEEYKHRIPEILDKIYSTKRKNNSFNTSEPEENLYKLLIEKYGEEDVERQYKDNVRYPWCCDFHIRSSDTFIELQGMWTHGSHPYDPSSMQDQVKLQSWQAKANDGSKFYKNAIEVWTMSDVKKRSIAKQNNLRYIEVFDLGFKILYEMSIL